MRNLDEFEFTSVLPKITEQFRLNPEGVTVEYIESVLILHGIKISRERIEKILDELAEGRFCERDPKDDVTFYIPNPSLYAAERVS